MSLLLLWLLLLLQRWWLYEEEEEVVEEALEREEVVVAAGRCDRASSCWGDWMLDEIVLCGSHGGCRGARVRGFPLCRCKR
jgi:hypothetical protein